MHLQVILLSLSSIQTPELVEHSARMALSGTTSSGGGGGKPSAAAAQPEPDQSSDILASLPGPVIRLLIIFSNPIAWLRIIAEVLLWKPGRRVESWMVVLGWWGICLGFSYSFRYVQTAPIDTFVPNRRTSY